MVKTTALVSSKAVSGRLIHDLSELLSEGSAATQEEIRDALLAKKHRVNQSKVSRLLRKINAIKSKNELGEIVYHLPFEPAPPTLDNKLVNLIIDVVANETTIIINTSPGSAQLIARLLDYNKSKLKIIGTIAGDDTVFIAPESVKKIRNSMNEIKKLLLIL